MNGVFKGPRAVTPTAKAIATRLPRIATTTYTNKRHSETRFSILKDTHGNVDINDRTKVREVKLGQVNLGSSVQLHDRQLNDCIDLKNDASNFVDIGVARLECV